MAEMFLEDFVVGQVFSSARHVRVDKDEIIAFAKKYDPQFFHLDEEAARSSIFGGLVASGWLTAALDDASLDRAGSEARGRQHRRRFRRAALADSGPSRR